MKRVLIISDPPFSPSTFGNLTRDIAYQLHVNGMSVAVLGFGYSGWPFSDPMIPYPLYPWIGPPQQPQNIDDIFDEFKPDTLLLLGAPILFGWLRDHPRRNEFRLVLHTAFKSLPLVTTMRDIYNLSDMIIVNSLYEENNIHAALIEKDICRIPPFINKNKLYSSHENKKESGDFFGVACVAYDIPRMDMQIGRASCRERV